MSAYTNCLPSAVCPKPNCLLYDVCIGLNSLASFHHLLWAIRNWLAHRRHIFANREKKEGPTFESAVGGDKYSALLVEGSPSWTYLARPVQPFGLIIKEGRGQSIYRRLLKSTLGCVQLQQHSTSSLPPPPTGLNKCTVFLYTVCGGCSGCCVVLETIYCNTFTLCTVCDNIENIHKIAGPSQDIRLGGEGPQTNTVHNCCKVFIQVLFKTKRFYITFYKSYTFTGLIIAQPPLSLTRLDSKPTCWSN